MRRTITTVVGLSALLVCSLAAAQSNAVRPAQLAQPATQVAQAAPAPVGAATSGGVAAGTAGTVTLPAIGAVTTTAVVGTAIGLGIAGAVATTSDNTTTGTK